MCNDIIFEFGPRDNVIVCFLTCMRGWLVGCQLKNQVLPLGKVFVTRPLCGTILESIFFPREKTKAGKTTIALDFTSHPGREYGFSGFITTSK